MNARAVVAAALAALAFGGSFAAFAAPDTLVELKLRLFVMKSGKLVPAAFAPVHISDDTAASRTTDADGQLEIELGSGKHTVNVLVQKPCRFDVTLVPKKPLDVSEVVPDDDATLCKPTVAPKASAASAVAAASAASAAGSTAKGAAHGNAHALE